MNREKILIAVLGILLLGNMFGCDVGGRAVWTPLHIEAYRGRPDLVELLIAKGADVNAKDLVRKTPLHQAKNKEVAELLIAKGADVNAKDKNGLTPLLYATIHGHKDVAELLRKHGGK